MPSLVLLLALLAFQQPPDLQQSGLQALDHQDYVQAAAIFGKLAAADAKDYTALFNLALAESGLKRDEEAAAHYRQVLVLKPGLYEAELNLGIVLLHQHKAEEALTQLQEAAKQKPAEARVQRFLGQALLERGDNAGATDAFRRALQSDPKLGVAELGLGQALLRQNKLDEALPHYQAAAALEPSYRSFLLEIAGAFSQSNRQQEAISLLTQFPDDVAAREELGRLYLALNRPADAVASFEAAVRLAPSTANQIALASAYLKNNQELEAKPLLERALAANPNDFELRMVVARIHRDQKQYVVAGNEFVQAAALRPDSVEAWQEAASVFVIADQYPQALAALDKVHNLKAETEGDFYYRAIVFDKLHSVKPALANYQRFLEMSQGKHPDQEFIARQRSRILEREASR